MKYNLEKPWKQKVEEETGQEILCAKYEFIDFKESMAFASKVAEIADKLFHHPEVIVAWGYCIIKLWTHESKSLTAKDYEFANEIVKLVSTSFGDVH